jgi:hypothetical protein
MRVIGLAVVLGISLVLAPLLGEAQPTPVKLAMLLTSSPEGAGASEYAAFAKQLSALGWIEGQNLEVDRRWANAPENFVGLAADAVRAKPAVIRQLRDFFLAMGCCRCAWILSPLSARGVLSLWSRAGRYRCCCLSDSRDGSQSPSGCSGALDR